MSAKFYKKKLFSNINKMNKEELEKLSKSQLINLIFQQNKKTIIQPPIEFQLKLLEKM